MTVAALSTAGFSQYIAASSNVSVSQQAWQSLQQSLAQGNLSAAASAFKTYNQLNPAPASSSSNASAPSQLTTDMTALGSAISSGNLSTAQSAFATVQNDLKTTPSQAMTNAESAVAQTVQWVDDLLSLSDSSSSSSTPVDPTTSILDSAYGQNSSSSTTDPTVALLENKYGDGSTASTSSASSSSTAGTSSTASAPSAVSSGNAGSSASINVYA
jgi:ribosomal protein S20